MLSRLIITFLPRSKRLLISWLQSPSAVILEPPKIKPDTVSTVSPSSSHEVMGQEFILFLYLLGISLPFHLVYIAVFGGGLLYSGNLWSSLYYGASHCGWGSISGLSRFPG